MMKLNFERLVFDQEPISLLFISEPYIVNLKTGFTVAADVIMQKVNFKVEKTVLLGAQSLTAPLFERMLSNRNNLSGIEVWIYKSGVDKTSKYIEED